MAVFLLFANGALTVGITIAAFPSFREYSEAMALWLLAVSVIMFSLQAVDNIHVLSMLSLSQQYVQAGGPDGHLPALAAFVLVTVMLHFTGIPLRRFVGESPAGLMGVPMAVSHMALAIWLMARGLDQRPRPLGAEAQRVELRG